MQHVAAEMQRDDYFRSRKMPLLIGGATTSRVHTAVKIAPHYEGPVVYVPDASRSVGVCSDLLSDDKRRGLPRRDRRRLRARARASTRTRRRRRWSRWRRRVRTRRAIDWAGYTPPKPKFIGRRVFRNYDLAELAACIDWGPFFQTWDLAGRYPAILDDEVVGDAARRVFDDGQAMLKRRSRAAGSPRSA